MVGVYQPVLPHQLQELVGEPLDNCHLILLHQACDLECVVLNTVHISQVA